MQCPDIFFTPEYQDLFAQTEFGGEPCQYAGYLFYKRRIEGTSYFDIVSPYGYSGHTQESAKNLDSFHIWCLQENIIAEFARLHPFIENHKCLESDFLKYEHEIYYVDLTQSEDDIWKGFDKGCKSAIKKAQKDYLAEIRISNLSELMYWYTLYTDTMRRIQASDSYFFTRAWSVKMFYLFNDNIAVGVCFDDEAERISQSILLRYGDYCHYFLSGSKERSQGASNLVLWKAIKWAKTQGCKVFNLGGGLKAGDSLESFKRSFTKTSKPFFTYRKIHNQEVYNQLCRDKGVQPNSDGFFPAYRRI